MSVSPAPAASILEEPGPLAAELGALWWVMLILGTAATLLVLVLLGVRLFRRRPPPDPESEIPVAAEPPVGRGWLVGGGLVLPIVLITVVWVMTVGELRGLADPAPDALPIEVVGHMWWWEVHYPEAGATTANEVHVPAGRPVELHLTSADVIHSFWVPPLAGKLDLLPDGVNVLPLTAEEPGIYRGRCAEFCGLQHAKMELLLVAHPPGEFAAWLEGQAEAASEPATAEQRRGREVFFQAGCAECHTIRGTVAVGEQGPDLTHLGARETLGAVAASNTAAELAAWIADPHQFKPGVAMPAHDLPPEDLDALVAYLRSLR